MARFTDTDGDELWHTNLTRPDNWTFCNRLDGTAVATANFEIAGGTGKHAGAHGWYSARFDIPVDEDGVPPPDEFSATVEGVIFVDN